jgi:pyridoxal phosphate enzyme (YggS family)
MTDIKSNLKAVREEIAEAAEGVGRDPAEVTLVAVSKVHSAEAIREAHAAGQRHFGENYAQELVEKDEALEDLDGIVWHFIGHLQRNKAKLVVQTGAMVETVDSVRLVAELVKQAERSDQHLDCLVQVNVGEEEQKSGVAKGAVEPILEAVQSAPRLTLAGLMTIPPFHLEAEETRKHFIALRELRETLGGPDRLPHLSMGMSHDFDVAVEEGATLVRVGTAIFGERVYK